MATTLGKLRQGVRQWAPRNVNRIAYIGDSRVAQMHADGASLIGGTGMKRRNARNHRVWGDAMSGRRTITTGNFGNSGDRLDQVYVRLPAALATMCGTLDIEGGLNDVAQAATGYVAVAGPYAGTTVNLTNVLTVMTATAEQMVIDAVNAGVRNIIYTLDPGASNLSATAVGIIIAFNQNLREMAERYPGMVVFDLPATIWNPASTGAAISFITGTMQNESGNFVHCATLGGYLGGLAYAELLKGIMPLYPNRPSAGTMSNSALNKVQLLANPVFSTATGGTIGAGCSGTLPASFTIGRSGAATAVVSTGVSPDGLGNEVIIDYTFTAAGELIRVYQDLANTDWEFNQIFHSGSVVSVDAGSTGLLVPQEYMTNAFNSGSIAVENSDFEPFTADVGPPSTASYTLHLRTEPFMSPSDKGAKSWLGRQTRFNASGAGTGRVRIRTPWLTRRNRMP